MFNAPHDIETLLAHLHGDDPAKKQSAIIALAQVKDARIIPDLIAALDDPDSTVRANAASGLGENNATEAINKLIDRLRHDEHDIVRERSATALAKIGDERAIEPLIDALDDPATWTRNRIIYVLGASRDERAIDPLLELLDHRDVSTVGVAAWALGAIGSARAYPALLALLTHKDASVRGNAAFALGELADERAITPLIDRLSDEDAEVRAKTAWALGSLGEALGRDDMVSALIALLDDFTEVAGQAQYQFVAQYAAEALLQIGTEPAKSAVSDWKERARVKLAPYRIAALIQNLTSPERDLRAEVITALADFGQSAVDPLIQALGHRVPRVRQGSAQALGEIGAPEAVPALLMALADDDGGVWSQAVGALAKCGQQQTKLITPALKSDKIAVRYGSAMALWRIQRDDAAFRLVLEAVHSDDILWKSSAITSLWLQPDERAVAALQIELGKADGVVKAYILQALTAIGTPQAQATVRHYMGSQ